MNRKIKQKDLRPRQKWTTTARQALLYALPLALVALFATQWLDLDFTVQRENAQKEMKTIADSLGAVGARAVGGLSADAWDNIHTAQKDKENANARMWQVIYAYNLNLLYLKRQGGERVFPPKDPLAMPKMWEEKLRALVDVADLLHRGDNLNGWFPHVSGEYYFECHRRGVGAARSESCLALADKLIFPNLFAALAARTSLFPGWSFRLRDPFDRTVWRRGASTGAFDSFTLSGPLHNWVLEISGAPPPERSAWDRLVLAAPLTLIWLLLVYQSRRAQNALLAESAERAAMATRLSHDLRTPLANLKLYAELIARKSAGTPELDRYCAVLTEEIDRLDLLAGETIAAKSEAPNKAKVAADPCALAHATIDRYEKLLAASGSTCELHCETTKILRFQTGAFERILINLIDNARKYAPGRIWVGIEWRDNLLELVVRDFGVGGAGNKIPGPSHGMGLAIVRELAQANGGDFALSGANPGLCAKATIAAEAVEEA